jgi:pathogenesis-related protein 1
MPNVRKWGTMWAAAGLVVLGGCDLLFPPDGGSNETADAPAFPQNGIDAGLANDDAVAAHNEIRAAAVPTPSPPLPAMHWDDSAARVADSWAANCMFAHSHTPGYGENIYASTSTDDTAREAVVAWASEVTDYDYASNSCAAGKVCGHYTQLVWRSSTGVGCASRVCDVNSPFSIGNGHWLLWVCDYIPPGNYIGERPY